MEHYQKASTSKSHPFQEKADGRIHINAGGKINAYVSAGLNIINEKNLALEIIGIGKATTKAVSVAEIIKRKLHEPHQITEIFHQQEIDEWIPITKGLEAIHVTRHTPAIRIRLEDGQIFDE